MQDIRKPIGPFQPYPFSEELLLSHLNDIKHAPAQLADAIAGLTEDQLVVPYREDGWNSRQIVHHVADSHMNAYIRCKLAMTEDNPIIKPYDQDTWAILPDNNTVSVHTSVELLKALHTRWYAFFSELTPEDWNRTVMHPEYNRQMSLWFILGLYAWHGKHHAAQIKALRALHQW